MSAARGRWQDEQSSDLPSTPATPRPVSHSKCLWHLESKIGLPGPPRQTCFALFSRSSPPPTYRKVPLLFSCSCLQDCLLRGAPHPQTPLAPSLGVFSTWSCDAAVVDPRARSHVAVLGAWVILDGLWHGLVQKMAAGGAGDRARGRDGRPLCHLLPRPSQLLHTGVFRPALVPKVS